MSTVTSLHYQLMLPPFSLVITQLFSCLDLNAFFFELANEACLSYNGL